MSRGSTLQDPRLQRELHRDGYAVLDGAAAGDLDELRAAVASVAHPRPAVALSELPVTWTRATAPGPSWRISLDEDDLAARRAFADALAPFWCRLLQEQFRDHRLLYTAWLTKEPGLDGVLPLHQDPTVVDERAHRAVTAWVALDDIGPEEGNGALRVVPGSNRCASRWRGAGTDDRGPDEMERLWRHALELRVRAGDVVLLDAALVHGSPPNTSAHARSVVVAVIVPRAAELLTVARSTGGSLDVYSVDDEFFHRWTPRVAAERPPTGRPVVARVDNDHPSLSRLAWAARTTRLWRYRRSVGSLRT